MPPRTIFKGPDSDTGEEIVVFTRLGRIYAFLRDARTKRFIRRLRRVEVRVYAVVDYKGRKGNPIYIDVVVKTILRPEHFLRIRTIAHQLALACLDVIREYFGRYVERLAAVSGIEYGSQITVTAEYPAYKWVIVWRHHKWQQYRSMEGEDTL